MLANLRALFGVILDIILMRRGPEHLPGSPAILAITVAVNLAVSALLIALTTAAPKNWPLQIVLGTTVSLLWFRFALVLLNKRERYAQTMTAIFGTATLFLPAMIPLSSAVLPYLQQQAGLAAAAPPSALAIPFAFIALWQLIVQVRIVHAAFEWSYLAAILFIFGQGFVSIFVFWALFGVSQSQG